MSGFVTKRNLILINNNSYQTRIAQLEKGSLHSLYWEISTVPSQVGSIYKAQVTKKCGLDACFVDIGLARSAFLYIGKDKTASESEEVTSVQSGISDINPGQVLMVQIIKDPLKGKNFRVSSKISLPGLYLVYLPNSPFSIGVSRQIEDEKKREKLIHYVEECNPKEGVIIRTRAAYASKEELKKDWENLKMHWKDIQNKYQSQKKPNLVWSDIPLSAQILRNTLDENIEQVLIDDERTFSYLQEFTAKEMPKEKCKISLYKNNTVSLFDKYKLESQLEGLLKKKVKLKSGGGIVIEETEAAVVVDVNTGKFIGKNTPEKNILKINLEAAKEIAIQVRLRNCGGIILIDFIDMEEEDSRQKVMRQLEKELAKDRVPIRVLPISEIGIVQLTRKRDRASLLGQVCQPCSYCNGGSYVKKVATVASEILRCIGKKSKKASNGFLLFCHPEVAECLKKDQNQYEYVVETKQRQLIKQIEEKSFFQIEQFEIHEFDEK